jgi:hypothetical protein
MTDTDLPVTIELSSSCPLAQREHCCIICNSPIAIGSRYFRHVIRNNDLVDKKHNLRVLKYHLACPQGGLDV